MAVRKIIRSSPAELYNYTASEYVRRLFQTSLERRSGRAKYVLTLITPPCKILNAPIQYPISQDASLWPLQY